MTLNPYPAELVGPDAPADYRPAADVAAERDAFLDAVDASEPF